MSEISPGARVGAFDASNAIGEIRMFGYGTYAGRRLIPGWRELATELLPIQRASWRAIGDEKADRDDANALQWLADNAPSLSGPLIELDDGRKLWGFHTWWMAEDRARAMVAEQESQGYRLVPV
jgi:hypothetical protein